MGFLCKTATAECVENFEVSGICADDLEESGVPVELELLAFCQTHHHSFSWVQQCAGGKDGVRKFAVMGKGTDAFVPFDMLIPDQAKYCGALVSMPAGAQLLPVKNYQGSCTPTLPLTVFNLYQVDSHEVNEAFDELLD